jgi:hypothetical protein
MNVVQDKVGRALVAVYEIPKGDLPPEQRDRYDKLMYEVSVLYLCLSKATAQEKEDDDDQVD